MNKGQFAGSPRLYEMKMMLEGGDCMLVPNMTSKHQLNSNVVYVSVYLQTLGHVIIMGVVLYFDIGDVMDENIEES